MIVGRVARKLRAQDWFAIGIELVIVVIGVFVGQQVSNWNEVRIERAKTEQLARDLEPELRSQSHNYQLVVDYHAAARRYGDTAFAGWRNDPRVSDRDFVIAAYQSSQIILSGLNTAAWSQIFGSDRLRDLENKQFRELLAVLMTADLAVLERDLSTDYRRNVRMLIPEDVQDAIRKSCGDRRRGIQDIILPEKCTVDVPDTRFVTTAQSLRAHPELVGDLRYHFAVTASYSEYVQSLISVVRAALQQLDRS